LSNTEATPRLAGTGMRSKQRKMLGKQSTRRRAEKKPRRRPGGTERLQSESQNPSTSHRTGPSKQSLEAEYEGRSSNGEVRQRDGWPSGSVLPSNRSFSFRRPHPHQRPAIL
ncbi:MAG: hypothetical protein ALECFALPRED_009617, partial [Alectoria fallacina]